MLSPIQVLNEIGKFSQKNVKFLNNLKNKNIEFENTRKTKKNITKIGPCSVTYNYDDMEIQTKGKCQDIEELIVR